MNQDQSNLIPFTYCIALLKAAVKNKALSEEEWRWASKLLVVEHSFDQVKNDVLRFRRHLSSISCIADGTMQLLPLTPICALVNQENGGKSSNAIEPIPLTFHHSPKIITQDKINLGQIVYNLEKDLQKCRHIQVQQVLYHLKKHLFWLGVGVNTGDKRAAISFFEEIKIFCAGFQLLHSFGDTIPDEPFLINVWDVTGIQKFIYSVSSKKAASGLKGRSFYLNLLNEYISDLIERETTFSKANILYASGGKMFMLLPNNECILQGIERIREMLDDYLWQNHRLELYVCTGYISFGGNGIYQQYCSENVIIKTSDLWSLAIRKAAEEKGKKYQRFILRQENEHSIFKPESILSHRVCMISGQVETSQRKLVRLPDSDDANAVVTKAALQQIKLGNSLKHASALVKWRNKHGDKDVFSFDEAFQIEVIDQSDLINLPSSDISEIIFLNEVPENIAYGLKKWSMSFYGGNKQAYTKQKNIERPKTFEELAEMERSNTYLGVLRMDVDFLGNSFISGIPNEYRSLAGYTTLSGQLEWFFCGYLNQVRKQSAAAENHCNILYAGGDDLFMVGRWEVTIDMAEAIQAAFSQFTQSNPKLSISGGISIVSNKFPIQKAADFAGEAEEAAKEHTNPWNKTESKNAICMFGVPLNWNSEFPKVKAIKEELVQSGISKSLIFRMMEWKENKDQFMAQRSSSTIDAGSFRWHAAYILSRHKETEKKDNANRTIQSLLNLYLTGKASFNNTVIDTGGLFEKSQNFLAYDLGAVAARWAELTLKIKTKTNLHE
jgi:CRISPR-associated protein Csm1